MSAVIKYLKRNQKTHLNQLLELLAIPSISTDAKRKPAMRKAATWMQKRLKAAGCTKAEINNTPGHPIVYGEWLGAEGRPTILVYGHYDVQPVDPLKLWKIPPFEPTVRKGKIFARGASDDKGTMLAPILAAEAHLRTGALPWDRMVAYYRRRASARE